MALNIKSEPSQILPGLWLGDMFTAGDKQFFSERNIKAVINCTPDVPDYFRNQGVSYHRVNLDDSLQQKDFDDMLEQLPGAVTWLYDKYDLQKLPTYVHCHKGIQRSCTVITAFLFHTRKPDLKECIRYLIHKRPIAFFGGRSINFGSPLSRVCYKKDEKKKNSS